MKKRGAMELSMTTLIVVILSLLMLILGTVLVKNVTCSAIHGITSLDDVIKDELRKLFTDENKNVVVKERNDDIIRGVDYGVSFLVRNDEQQDSRFTYSIGAVDLGDCHISGSIAESYIVLGRSNSVDIPVGGEYGDIARFEIPKDAPLCSLRYQIVVKNGGEIYDSDSFDVKIVKSSFLQANLC